MIKVTRVLTQRQEKKFPLGGRLQETKIPRDSKRQKRSYFLITFHESCLVQHPDSTRKASYFKGRPLGGESRPPTMIIWKRRQSYISYLDPFSFMASLLRAVFRPEVGSDLSSVGDPNPALK